MQDSILERDTLSFQLGHRPGVVRINRSEVRVPALVDRLNLHMDKVSSTIGCFTEPIRAHPELDAVLFYFMNHVVSLLRKKYHPLDRLGPAACILEEYHAMLAIKSTRMFYYLLLICTRESRHVKDSDSSTLFKKLAATYGIKCVAFHNNLRGSSSITASDRFRSNPPDVSLGVYTMFMADMFRQGNFSKGYGGVAWADVADVLRDYVLGVISAEIMMDTAFTLAHNNGPIFNKGMLFDGYTCHIYEILDVQRSGQIPRMIHNKETPWAANLVVKDLYESCSKLLGESVLLAGTPYVDWYLVQALGALHDCSAKQKLQVQKHGLSATYSAKVQAAELKNANIIAEANKELAKEAAMWVQITPNDKVKKITKERVQ